MNLLKRNHCVDSDWGFADETPSADTATKAPSAINAPGFARMLPPLLSVIAGSADVTSFLGLGLFSAHVTGNLVILTAHIVAREGDKACLALSLPLFILVLGLTRLLVAGLETLNIGSLRPLLLLQFLMLGGSFILCLPSNHNRDPFARNLVVAGQLTVAAMAVQNALGQLSSPKAPAAAVMTTNLARFIMDAGEPFWDMILPKRRRRVAERTILGRSSSASPRAPALVRRVLQQLAQRPSSCPPDWPCLH